MIDTGPDPLWAVFFKTDTEGDFIRREKTDAIKIMGQPVWIFVHKFNRIVTVLFVDPYGKKGTDAV